MALYLTGYLHSHMLLQRGLIMIQSSFASDQRHRSTLSGSQRWSRTNDVHSHVKAEGAYRERELRQSYSKDKSKKRTGTRASASHQ